MKQIVNKEIIKSEANVLTEIVNWLKESYGYEVNDSDLAFVKGFLAHIKLQQENQPKVSE